MVELVEFIELIEVHDSVGHVEVIELSGQAGVKGSHWASSRQLTTCLSPTKMNHLDKFK